MRGIVAIVGVFGGLGMIGYGVGTAVGWFDGPAPIAFITGGAIALLVGFLMTRSLSGGYEEDVNPFAPDPEDMTTTNPQIEYDHPLTGHLDVDAPSVPQRPAESPVPWQPAEPQATTESRPSPLRAAGCLGRIIALVIVLGFAFGGIQTAFDWIGDFLGDDSPNVPVHVLDACNEALRIDQGAAASFGTAYAYEQNPDGTAEVRFRTSQGGEWDCRWDPIRFDAEVADIRE